MKELREHRSRSSRTITDDGVRVTRTKGASRVGECFQWRRACDFASRFVGAPETVAGPRLGHCPGDLQRAGRGSAKARGGPDGTPTPPFPKEKGASRRRRRHERKSWSRRASRRTNDDDDDDDGRFHVDATLWGEAFCTLG